jgi:hypothetical protein
MQCIKISSVDITLLQYYITIQLNLLRLHIVDHLHELLA